LRIRMWHQCRINVKFMSYIKCSRRFYFYKN